MLSLVTLRLSGGLEKTSGLKWIVSVVGFLVLTALSGFGQQTGAFFRVVAPTNTKIKAFDSQGNLTWWNAATAGITCTVQRATTLAGPSNWLDYVQHRVTSKTMTARVYDPNPPAGMRLIPAGMNIGTDPDFGAYALTIQTAFYMDMTEVTKAQWDVVYTWAVTNGYSFDSPGFGKESDHPVYFVNWYDCVKWCNARSEQEGLTPCYWDGIDLYKTGQSSPQCNFESANGYRLPTVKEWEYAARGGLRSKRFPWGDTITHSQANYFSSVYCAFDTSPTRNYHPSFAVGDQPFTNPAGSFAPNGYGLYDMTGNVQEWCVDAVDLYYRRALRGGSYGARAEEARCHYDGFRYPSLADRNIGFRTVCVPSAVKEPPALLRNR